MLPNCHIRYVRQHGNTTATCHCYGRSRRSFASETPLRAIAYVLCSKYLRLLKEQNANARAFQSLIKRLSLFGFSPMLIRHMRNIARLARAAYQIMIDHLNVKKITISNAASHSMPYLSDSLLVQFPRYTLPLFLSLARQ